MAADSLDLKPERLAEEAWKVIEAERSGRPKLYLDGRLLRVLIEIVKEAEAVKPSQQAKRDVMKKHGFVGTNEDRILTAIFYDVMRKQGLLDRFAAEVAGVPSALVLDPWLRAALRVALDIALYHRPLPSTKRHLRWSVADFLSSQTHPFVGMFYWRLIDKVFSYRPRPKSVEELMEIKYLIPAWLIRRVRKLLGDEEAEELLKAFNTVPPISVRVNTLKASVEEVVEALRKEGKDPWVSDRVPVVVKFEGPYNLDKSRIHREGKIIVQEEASAAASIILDPKPGETVVDMCAAPGGKTTHLAELMKLKGRIYAFDVDPVRIKRMRENLRRTGTERIVRVIRADARKAPKILGEEVADKVLLDAPCSSTGTIAKNPELRWRVHEHRLEEIVDMQRQLLRAAAKILKPGGRLLYTVCSILPEEGEENVKWALKNLPLELVELKGPYDESELLPGTMRAWPHRHGTLGFFYALFEKKG